MLAKQILYFLYFEGRRQKVKDLLRLSGNSKASQYLPILLEILMRSYSGKELILAEAVPMSNLCWKRVSSPLSSLAKAAAILLENCSAPGRCNIDKFHIDCGRCVAGAITAIFGSQLIKTWISVAVAAATEGHTPQECSSILTRQTRAAFSDRQSLSMPGAILLDDLD